MKVFVVDDSALVRERLVALLAEVEGVDVVGSAESAEEGIEGISRSKPGMEAGADYFFDKSGEFHKVTDVLERMVAKETTG